MTISTWMSIFVVAATITLWATASLAEYLVALLFFVAALCLRLAPAEIVLSGFSSAAFWLVLSGFVLGVAIRKVGLADRLAHALAVCLTGSWSRMVGGVVLLTYALAFLMPSNMGRIALLMPIVMALADRAGLSKGSPGRIALTLAVGFGTFQLSGSILPANVPNLFMAGAAENAFGLHLSYLSYLLLHAPVIGFLKGSALVLCLCLLFPATLKLCVSQEHTKPLTQAEKRLGLLLLITLSLWATDTLHGISPAWIGLAAACICLMPRIGFINGDEFATGVNIRTCIYVAGILGLASLVNYSGLGSSLGKALHLILPLDPAHSASSFGGLVLLASALNFVVTAVIRPAILTP
jgi:di/tricarboxylate transporter